MEGISVRILGRTVNLMIPDNCYHLAFEVKLIGTREVPAKMKIIFSSIDEKKYLTTKPQTPSIDRLLRQKGDAHLSIVFNRQLLTNFNSSNFEISILLTDLQAKVKLLMI